MDKYQIAWVLLGAFAIFIAGYTSGFKQGQSEGFTRGRIAGRNGSRS